MSIDNSTQNYGDDLAESNGREILGGGVETYSYRKLEDQGTINVWTCNDGRWSQYPHKIEKPTNITSKPKGIDPYKPNTGGDMFDEKG
jgi:hypothetical protein